MARTRSDQMEEEGGLGELPAAALRAVLREGYTGRMFRADLAAGVVVGVVALPLAMALSIAVGLPPQYGLYTTMIAGFLTALLGGSRIQVVGPTAAFIVILAPIVAAHGMSGLLIAGLMSGAILLMASFLRLGRMIEYIPFPVTTGFTSGIAVVIAGLQLKDVFGLKPAEDSAHFLEKLSSYWVARDTASLSEFLIALATLAILLLPRLPRRWLTSLPKRLRKLPAPVLALPAAAGLAWFFNTQLEGWHVTTLGEKFVTLVDGVEVRGIPRSLPHFALPWSQPGAGGETVAFSVRAFQAMFGAAFAVAALGAIESLLSAVVADGMARTRHDPNSELFALGVSNLIAPFFGGIPATGAIARTATNYRFGGRTPVAAMVHALTVVLAVLVAAPLLAYLPMASLAALLMLVAWNMSEIEHFSYTLRVAPKADRAVMLICFALTVGMDMVVAVSVGVALGALFFMRKMARLTEGKAVLKGRKDGLVAPRGVLLYEIDGPLFFGAAERAMSALRNIGSDVRAVVFKLDKVLAIDMTGLVAMESALKELKRHGIKSVVSGARPQVRELFLRSGLKVEEGVLAYAETPREAFRLLSRRASRYQRKELGPVRFHVLHRHKAGAKKSRRQTG